MTKNMQRELTEEEAYVLNIFVFGAMEAIYGWIAGGMTIPVERMVDFQEKAMPEIIKKWVMTSENVPYKETIKVMESYIAAEGLLHGIS